MKERFRLLLAAAVRAWLARRGRPLEPTGDPVVVVAPHADDETLGCGALLALRAERGWPTVVVFVSDSAAEGWSEAGSRAGRAALRRGEALAALRALGLGEDRARFLDGPDGALDRLAPEERERLVAGLAAEIRAVGAAEVFTPYRGDGSSEHTAATALVEAAGRRLSPRPRLREYPVWAWWNALRLRPYIAAPRRVRVLDAGPWLARKRAALACHGSQRPTRTPTAGLPPVLAALADAPVELFLEPPSSPS
jgi:LmbE family N-acetylglucosaminyl deacetylase